MAGSSSSCEMKTMDLLVRIVLFCFVFLGTLSACLIEVVGN